MPPLEQKTDAPAPSIGEQIREAVAPLEQRMEENTRALAQLSADVRALQASASAQEQKIVQIATASAAQSTKLSDLSRDLQVAATAILLKLEKAGRLG